MNLRRRYNMADEKKNVHFGSDEETELTLLLTVLCVVVVDFDTLGV